MRNWITYNCKIFSSHTILYMFCLMYGLISNATQATNLSINVYLKLKPDNQVTALIKDFNHWLQQNELLDTYLIQPFIHNHPLHITLYLATYEGKQITAIMKKTQVLAQQQKQLSISTHRFQASPSGYVMLTVDPGKQLQQLSNETVMTLAGIRDKNALFPTWASKNIEWRAMFTKWGSPSVLNYFQPHFSIFNPDHLNQKQQAELYSKLLSLIDQFCKTHQMKVKATAYAIGVGITDSQGQIVKELGAFELH